MEHKRQKRAHNTGSKIYQRKDGTFETRVTIPGIGKRVSIYGKSEEEVERKRSAALGRIGSNTLPVKNIALSEWCDTWLDDQRNRVRPKTLSFYTLMVQRFIVPALGRVRLVDLTPRMVNNVLNDLDGKVSPQTRKHVRSVLRQVLEAAMAENFIERNVAKLSQPVKMDARQVRYLNNIEVRTFLQVIEGHRLQPLLITAIATGLRQGELLGLRWQDVDLENGLLHVRYQLQIIDRKPTLVAPKSATSRRSVPIPAVVIDAIRHQQSLQETARHRAGTRWVETSHVFTSTIGTPLYHRTVLQEYQTLLKKAGLPNMRFHDLRHTAATLMLSLGVDASVIKRMLGHSTITLTLDTYAHVMPTGTAEAARRMGILLRE